MKRISKGVLCAVIALTVLILTACGDNDAQTASFEAMDTLMSLTVYGGGSGIRESLSDRIYELDALFDAVDESSEIYRLNKEKSARVSEDTAALIRASLELSRSMDGRFDITVYPAVLEWGFTTGEYNIPDEETLKRLAESIDCSRVEQSGDTVAIPDGAMLDLGAVAKGYAADACLDILRGRGAKAAVLNLGGTIALFGEKPDGSPFRVGVADPDNPAGYFGYISCGEGVISTSGGYERYFERDGKRYIHILDPETAAPVDNGILSVTVISDSGAAADALSTALFVMGLDKAVEYYRQGFRELGRDFIILTGDGELYLTDGVYDSFTLAEGYDYKINRLE